MAKKIVIGADHGGYSLKEKLKISVAKKGFKVKSAGTMGINGLAPADNTIKMLTTEGIDSVGYLSTGLDRNLLDWANMVMIMEPMHKKVILELDPGVEDNVFFLGQFSGSYDNLVIPDPIGRSLKFYDESFNVIKQSIEGLLEWLKK